MVYSRKLGTFAWLQGAAIDGPSYCKLRNRRDHRSEALKTMGSSAVLHAANHTSLAGRKSTKTFLRPVDQRITFPTNPPYPSLEPTNSWLLCSVVILFTKGWGIAGQVPVSEPLVPRLFDPRLRSKLLSLSTARRVGAAPHWDATCRRV